MKIAITSDLHLTAREKHPERFDALESLLRQMAKESLDTLIIAGDLFDEHSRNYAEFDAVCKKARSTGIRFLIIPGNHDSGLKQSSFTSENVTMFEKPEIHQMDLISMPFLFVPYIKDKDFGGIISDFSAELAESRWILIGHGEWIGGLRERNPLEPGVYMPLGRADVERFRPAQVLLGHIHKQMDSGPVHYCGSPCPLDINETGRRRFIILDTETGAVESRTIETGPIFLQANLVVLPLENELEFIREAIQIQLKSWALSTADMERARIRVTLKGYSSNKRLLGEAVREAFRRFRFYQNEEPNLEEVSDAEESDRNEIAQRAGMAIEALRYEYGPDDPDPDEVLLQALKVIYEAS